MLLRQLLVFDAVQDKSVSIWLRDYDCNAICSNSKISHSSSALLAFLDLSSKFLYPLTHFVNYNKFSPSYRQFLALVTAEIESTKYSEAISYPKWRLAMKDKRDALG